MFYNLELDLIRRRLRLGRKLRIEVFELPQFIKMGLHSTGFQGQPDNVRRNRQKFAGRRRVKEGYPWTGEFSTSDEVARYIGGDTIECLLCGRTFKRLGVHRL
jgi:hypothetical protein